MFGFYKCELTARQEIRKTATFTQYAVAATEEALEDAGWKPNNYQQKEATVRQTRLSHELYVVLTLSREYVWGLG